MSAVAAPVERELLEHEIDWTLGAAPVDAYLPVDGRCADILADAVIDALSYRTLAQEAIHALHALTRRHDQLHQQHTDVREKYAELRAQVRAA